jgi:hypothetical protein
MSHSRVQPHDGLCAGQMRLLAHRRAVSHLLAACASLEATVCTAACRTLAGILLSCLGLLPPHRLKEVNWPHQELIRTPAPAPAPAPVQLQCKDSFDPTATALHLTQPTSRSASRCSSAPTGWLLLRHQLQLRPSPSPSLLLVHVTRRGGWWHAGLSSTAILSVGWPSSATIT